MYIKWLCTFLLIFLVFLSCGEQDNFPVLKGPYFGQTPPGMIPELFAPGIITTEYHEHSSPAFSKDEIHDPASAFLEAALFR